ncbi:hypothetical protein F4703DRAFT_1821960 [Phycomyces blakesleeanus]
MATPHPIAEMRQALLSDGTVVRVNDHVFLASEHLGEPYHVGRIMEFPVVVAGKGQQARIAWFNRPKDVVNRKHHDPRLLFATMQSDLNPVSAIRGKCTVTHKHYIGKEGLEMYRSLEDHFYFHRLYDRYMQRMYEVVACEAVQNVPLAIQTALRERYQFVVVEQAIADDLIVDRCNCCMCDEWCASAKSVKCAACLKSYHMSCLNPPLLRKPSKGFAWQCASCTREELLGGSSQNTSTPSESDSSSNSSKPVSSSRPKRQTRTATRANVTKTTQKQIKKRVAPTEPRHTPKAPEEMTMTAMWPFRYFNMSTQLLDIESNNNCYPHAKSRIGAKYQADTPDFKLEEALAIVDQSRSSTPLTTEEISQESFGKVQKRRYNKRVGRPIKRRSATSPNPSKEPEQEEVEEENAPIARGTDATLSPMFRRTQWTDDTQDNLEKYMLAVKALPDLPLPPHSGDLLDRALLEYERSNYDASTALSIMARLTTDDFYHVPEWSEEELEAFEQGVRDHGHDFNLIKQRIPNKTMPAIIRFFYQWKKTDRYEPVYSEWTKVYRPTKRIKRRATMGQDGRVSKSPTESLDSEDDSEEETDLTVVPISSYEHANYRCTNCHTTESSIWRRPPSDTDRRRKEFKFVVCDLCGVYWLKYGKNMPITPECLAANNRGRGRPLKAPFEVPKTEKRKQQSEEPIVTSASNADLVAAVTKTEHIPIRKRIKLIKDRINASRQSHAPKPCSLCSHLEPKNKLLVCADCSMSVHNDCIGSVSDKPVPWICDVCTNRRHPKVSSDYTCVICLDTDRDTRRPMKPTSDYKWAHVSCATFIPEVKLVHPETLQPIEYINAIHPARWQKDCEICHNSSGAKVACGDCNKLIHVECAVRNQFQLAFEVVQPPKSFSIPLLSPGAFDPHASGGMMIPQVWCPEHSLLQKHIIPLHARTLDTQDSTFKTYAHLYKSIESDSTSAMRKIYGINYKYARTGSLSLAFHHPRLIKSTIPTASSSHIIPSPRQSAIAAMAKKFVPSSSLL